jgi:hypothetical protein
MVHSDCMAEQLDHVIVGDIQHWRRRVGEGDAVRHPPSYGPRTSDVHDVHGHESRHTMVSQCVVLILSCGLSAVHRVRANPGRTRVRVPICSYGPVVSGGKAYEEQISGAETAKTPLEPVMMKGPATRAVGSGMGA